MNFIKRLLLIISAFTFTYTLHAQFSVYALAGTMNYGGDLQSKKFTFNQAHPAFGIGVTYKFYNHFSVAYSLIAGKISASDSKSNSPDRVQRNLNFSSSIGEANLTVEASLKDVPSSAKFSPYVFAGIGLFRFNPYTSDSAGTKVYLQPLNTEGQGLAQYNRKSYNLTQFSFPFGLGVKYALTNKITIGAEVSFHKIFTDYLDDVSSRSYADTALLSSTYGPVSAALSFRGDELNPPTSINTIRGNPSKKDTYYSCLIKVTYSLQQLNVFKY